MIAPETLLPPLASARSADLDDAVAAALDAAAARHARLVRLAMAESGGEGRLTLPQLRCLQAMARADGHALPSRLARELAVTPPTMTRTLDGLVERGLVDRQPDPASRRQVALTLTDAGREELARHEAAVRERVRRMLARLEPATKQQLLAALNALATAATGDDGR